MYRKKTQFQFGNFLNPGVSMKKVTGYGLELGRGFELNVFITPCFVLTMAFSEIEPKLLIKTSQLTSVGFPEISVYNYTVIFVWCEV